MIRRKSPIYGRIKDSNSKSKPKEEFFRNIIVAFFLEFNRRLEIILTDIHEAEEGVYRILTQEGGFSNKLFSNWRNQYTSRCIRGKHRFRYDQFGAYISLCKVYYVEFFDKYPLPSSF